MERLRSFDLHCETSSANPNDGQFTALSGRDTTLGPSETPESRVILPRYLPRLMSEKITPPPSQSHRPPPPAGESRSPSFGVERHGSARCRRLIATSTHRSRDTGIHTLTTWLYRAAWWYLMLSRQMLPCNFDSPVSFTDVFSTVRTRG